MEKSDHLNVSIIVPCYNEAATLRSSVERVLAIADDNTTLEIIIVDDGSTDGSASIARTLVRGKQVIKALFFQRNRGKGAALRAGLKEAGGDVVVFHDADLEYDPKDLRKMIDLLRENKAEAVFGSRFLTGDAHRVLYFWHSMGNRFLTFFSNLLTDLNLTDIEACYKAFKAEVVKNLVLEEDRFGIEPEIVAKVAEQGCRIYEVGITYSGRTYEEGKKVGYKDGFYALYCILRYNAWRAPLLLQFFLFLPFACIAGMLDKSAFELFGGLGTGLPLALSLSYLLFAVFQSAAATCFLFRQGARRRTTLKRLSHGLILILGLAFDGFATLNLIRAGYDPAAAKTIAIGAVLVFLFAAYRFLLFPSRPDKR